jgi:hypothetical protein
VQELLIVKGVNFPVVMKLIKVDLLLLDEDCLGVFTKNKYEP